LKAAGCTVIRSEKKTGSSRNGRTELETLMAFLRPGDALVVTRIDRLARSLRDLQNLVHELREKGAHLKATEQPIDTATAAGKMLPGHAGRLRRVRDQPPTREADRGDRRSEG
jgi:DNA invertase Pin-like site-specific DNA recombinase